MKYTYLESFTKTAADDISLVQKVLNETGAIVDAKLFPLIEDAENGDYASMAELFEMFTYGEYDIQPNFEMASRYCLRLNEENLILGLPDVISKGLDQKAYMYHLFGKEDGAHTAFLKAFKYMVANLEPNEWDKQIVNLVNDYVNGIE